MRRLVGILSVAAVASALLLGVALTSDAAPTPVFTIAGGVATFATAEEFPANFDYGYSGLNPVADPNAIRSFHGDHDQACGAPTTGRTVEFAGTKTDLDFSQVFWHCAPGGDPAKGHLMTGVDTHSYNIAWFSPKPAFEQIRRVCWDQNLTTMSKRKWTQVVFVTGADQTRFPDGMVTGGDSQARGSGGFDLGYTSPEFRFPNGDGPTTRVEPVDAGFAGLKVQDNGKASWFSRDVFTAQFVGSEVQSTDKAARYRHCIEQTALGVITFTQARPGGGQQVVTLPGTIPQGATRVVFQDDNYDPGKGDGYSDTVLTWHWDNIEVVTARSAPTTTAAPTTLPPSTTTMRPTTTSSSTTSTTVAPTSTSSSTTTAPPPSTTTTLLPAVACPPGFRRYEDDVEVICAFLKG